MPFDPFEHQICLHSPSYLSGNSSWIEHIPFGYALISILRPRVIVELGTYSGDSYFSFCEAVKILGLKTKCHAVDTWQGDEHAGFYGLEVFEAVNQYNRDNYEQFSELHQSTFDKALNRFEDGQIDMLHIDGLHTYDAVKHDFETWLPKLSKRGVVLLHDTQVTDRDFGVWKLWEELSRQYPSLEFVHCFGLGVLAVGANQSIELKRLISMSEEDILAISQFFATLGYKVTEKKQWVTEKKQRVSEFNRIKRRLHNLENSRTWRLFEPIRRLIQRINERR